MKFIIICLLSLATFSPVLSQEVSTITVNTMEFGTSAFKAWMKYPAFESGTVFFKDNSIAEARLNLNRLTGEIFFLSAKGDTLILKDPQSTSQVTIGRDTFCFYKDRFFIKLSHYEGSTNLFLGETLKYLGKEKKGAYGSYSSVAASNSSSSYTDDRQITTFLAPDENLLFNKRSDYLLSNSADIFYEVSRPALIELNKTFETEINALLKEHNLNLRKGADLLKLLEHLHALRMRGN
ncbi:MAG: hypothetical protein EOO01_16635 [Chitinophagaceae bacterium]|nr:MAG: hypothetical protein EOO01_16635 [Chitinophagaceae bacterium]